MRETFSCNLMFVTASILTYMRLKVGTYILCDKLSVNNYCCPGELPTKTTILFYVTLFVTHLQRYVSQFIIQNWREFKECATRKPFAFILFYPTNFVFKHNTNEVHSNFKQLSLPISVSYDQLYGVTSFNMSSKPMWNSSDALWVRNIEKILFEVILNSIWPMQISGWICMGLFSVYLQIRRRDLFIFIERGWCHPNSQTMYRRARPRRILLCSLKWAWRHTRAKIQ